MPATTALTTKYLTADDVAQTLKSTTDAVYGFIKNGGLPAHRVGRRWLIAAADLDAWMRSRDGSPTAERDGATAVDPDWVAHQVAKFTPDDLRRAARVLKSIVADLDAATGGGA
jgi:excisionase family DNA binding protein